MATSLLVFLDAYEPTYAQRAQRLQEVAERLEEARLPFALKPFAARVDRCTRWKIAHGAHGEDDCDFDSEITAKRSTTRVGCGPGSWRGSLRWMLWRRRRPYSPPWPRGRAPVRSFADGSTSPGVSVGSEACQAGRAGRRWARAALRATSFMRPPGGWRRCVVRSRRECIFAGSARYCLLPAQPIRKMTTAGSNSSARWRGTIGPFSPTRAHDARPLGPALRAARIRRSVVGQFEWCPRFRAVRR